MINRKIILLLLAVQTFAQEFYLLPTNVVPMEIADNRGVPQDSIRRHNSRSTVQKEVRGQSFGLEKFLTQPFNLDAIEDGNNEYNEQTQKPRGRTRHRGDVKAKKSTDTLQTFGIEDAIPKRNRERGNTFGLEKLGPQTFQADSAEINITPEKNFEMKRNSIRRDRRPVTFEKPAPSTEATKWQRSKYREKPEEINKHLRIQSEIESLPTEEESFPKPVFLPTVPNYNEDVTKAPKKVKVQKHEEGRKPLQRPSVFQTTAQSPVTLEEPKEQSRPRKRVMLRRRRKRPQKNTEVFENEERNQEKNKFESEVEDELYPRQQEETKKRFDDIHQQPFLESKKTEDVTPTPTKNFLNTEENVEHVEDSRTKRKRPLPRRQEEHSTPQTSTTVTTPAPEVVEEKKEEPLKRPLLKESFKFNPEEEEEEEKNDVDATFVSNKQTERKEEKVVATVTERKETVETSTQTSAHQLKTLLKQQSGTLSLSELLQTQNLSLSDFLRGNKGAISALGGKKVEVQEKAQEDNVEQDDSDKRKRLPKISPKSRPFSKPVEESETRLPHKKDEVVKDNLPKTLDVYEVTTDKPSYNGFQPKNPRLRLGNRGDKTKPEDVKNTLAGLRGLQSKRKTETTKLVSEATTAKPTTETILINELETTSPSPYKRDRLRLPSSRLPPTVNPKEASKEPKFLPKRYGDLRPKLRIDRRKISTTTTEAFKETVTASESNEIVTTDRMIDLTEKPIVRIPFMSSNNPDLSLILPSRNRSIYNDRHNRDRLSFLRTRTQDKQEDGVKPEDDKESDNIIKGKLKFRNFIKTTPSSTAETTTEKIVSNEEIYTTPIVRSEETTTGERFDSKDNSFESSFELPQQVKHYETQDEITELLKSGRSAHRLSKILQSRNMTLEELLEKRERGSQTNVEQLFEQKQNIQKITQSTTTTTTESNLKNTIPDIYNSTKHDAYNLFPNFPEFRYSSRPQLNQRSREESEFEELIADESFPASVKVRPDNRGPRVFPTFPIFDKNNQQSFQLTLIPSGVPLPIWNVNEKRIYNSNPYSYPNYEGRFSNRVTPTNVIPAKTENTESTNNENDIISFETINKSVEANRNLKSSIDEILKEQTETNEVMEEYEKAFLPPAVRSAIIASGVVLGIALFVFIAIFVACGCRQRHIRIRGKASILNDSLSRSNSDLKSAKKNNTLSPISFKRSGLYKKALDFETASSISNSSNASSYLWNTLKNTFTSRNNTLKNTLKNEELIRQENEKREDDRRNTLRTREERNGTRRNEEIDRKSSLRRDEERGIFTKIDPERNVINTSLTFKRGGLHGSSHNRYNTCAHLKS